jgi:hypothetical protein
MEESINYALKSNAHASAKSCFCNAARREWVVKMRRLVGFVRHKINSKVQSKMDRKTRVDGIIATVSEEKIEIIKNLKFLWALRLAALESKVNI